MMYIATITDVQAQELTGVEYTEGRLFNPIQDSTGSWMISEIEVSNSSIAWVNELPLIDSKHNERKAIVEGLILAAIDFGLGDFVKRFFFDHRDVIFEYENNGGTGLYELFETAIDSELDEMNVDGQSPRVYALEILG